MATLTEKANDRSDQNIRDDHQQRDDSKDYKSYYRQRAPRYAQQRRRRRQADSRDRCYGCGEFGHFQRECLRQREQPREHKMTNLFGKRSTPSVSNQTAGKASTLTWLLNTDRAVGRCPVASVTLGGVKAHALIDTGSEVTTMTESWLHEPFPQTKPACLNWLKLKGAYGLHIPYHDIIEVILTFGTQTLIDVIVLVLKDPDDVETRHRKKLQLVLLGMNVLGRIDNFLKECGASSIFQSVVHAQILNRTSVRGIAREQVVIQYGYPLNHQYASVLRAGRAQRIS